MSLDIDGFSIKVMIDLNQACSQPTFVFIGFSDITYKEIVCDLVPVRIPAFRSSGQHEAR